MNIFLKTFFKTYEQEIHRCKRKPLNSNWLVILETSKHKEIKKIPINERLFSWHPFLRFRRTSTGEPVFKKIWKVRNRFCDFCLHSMCCAWVPVYTMVSSSRDCPTFNIWLLWSVNFWRPQKNFGVNFSFLNSYG